ncbi:MAG: hypothetical protein OEZ59_04255 [Deltaproteobacteria bacterium]|nr:hypothetical protein [Deltaproteobacteria bacterium]
MTEKNARDLLKNKLELLQQVHSLTEQELLLVNLETLTPLLEKKDTLIEKIKSVDGELAKLEFSGKQALELQRQVEETVKTLLENERALEARIESEHKRLRKELMQFEKQTRLRSYLDKEPRRGGRLNVRK